MFSTGKCCRVSIAVRTSDEVARNAVDNSDPPFRSRSLGLLSRSPRPGPSVKVNGRTGRGLGSRGIRNKRRDACCCVTRRDYAYKSDRRRLVPTSPDEVFRIRPGVLPLPRFNVARNRNREFGERLVSFLKQRNP